MKTDRVLVVDDEAAILSLMEMALKDEGFDVVTATDGREALKKIEAGGIDIVVSDVQMPHLTGEMLLRAAKKQDSTIEVVLVTAHSTLDAAARAVVDGAYDYLSKPFNVTELIDIVTRALERRRLSRSAKGEEATGKVKNELIGHSRAMLDLFKMIGRAAPSDSTILVLGESGTGKEVIARQIHNFSRRVNKKFVAVNCGALTETLLESELFGHCKGAFTGAVSERRGLFEEANGGTIFLDEVTETSPTFQLKLLRVLQEGEILPVGASSPTKVDVRVIAASNQNIDDAVRDKHFRTDLLYRLRVITLMLPPLRDRCEDIPLLVEYFIKKYTPAGQTRPQISIEALAILQQHNWPGNVRELEHVIERAVVLNRSTTITPYDLPEEICATRHLASSAEPKQDDSEILISLAEVQQRHIRRVLETVAWNKSRAARILGIDRKTLDRMLERTDKS
jgi:two-component system, NtrC family, response regulator AtoC